MKPGENPMLNVYCTHETGNGAARYTSSYSLEIVFIYFIVSTPIEFGSGMRVEINCSQVV